MKAAYRFARHEMKFSSEKQENFRVVDVVDSAACVRLLVFECKTALTMCDNPYGGTLVQRCSPTQKSIRGAARRITIIRIRTQNPNLNLKPPCWRAACMNTPPAKNNIAQIFNNSRVLCNFFRGV